jgi:hypothetical protein
MFTQNAFAQDERAQVPPLLCNSYFEVNIGSIFYQFDGTYLEPGYTLQSVKVPHMAVRINLLGYEFNKYLSAQFSYMRPVLWVQYTYNKGSVETERTRTIWTNVGGLTIKPQLPVSDQLTIYGEIGLGIITRTGFKDWDGTPIVKDVNYSSILCGGGIKYNLNRSWGLMLSAVYSPENTKVKQPSTSFISAGFSYKLRPFTEKELEKSVKTGYIFPKQVIRIGYTSNMLGYGVNNFFAEGIIPVFWGGEAHVSHGFSINYQRNVFHGARVFSLDWGADASIWQGKVNKENFFTLSLYPVLSLTFLHTKPADFYFYYTVAGPTYCSKIMIDGKDLGKHFTFKDNIGAGFFFGERRNLNVEFKIGHYSNGNIFPGNEGVKIPLSLNLGYAF